MLKRIRSFLAAACFAFVLAALALIGTLSASYQKCAAAHEGNHGQNKQTNLHETIASGVYVPVLLLCEGAFIDENSGTFTAIATFAIAAFTLTLWRSTNRLWKSSEKQIAVAQKTAAAALRQVNAMVAIESPVLVLPQIKLVAYPNADDTKSIVDPVLEGEIPTFCRALVGIINSGRSNARMTRLCLEWRIMTILPDAPIYDTINIYDMDLLFGPNPNLITFFGIDHPANPVVLTGSQRTQIRSGQSLWVYGFFSYQNFMEETFDLGFLTRWNPPYGLVPIANQNYAYHRRT
jgi:hypothetical protein